MALKSSQVPPGKAKANPASAVPAVVLETGQVWKAGETYVYIKEAGKRLIHYKMAKGPHRPGLRKHLASIKTVRAFLKSQRAELMPAGSTGALAASV